MQTLSPDKATHASSPLVGGVRSPKLIEHMRIGYAPGGGGLRAGLIESGYPLSALRQAGLVTSFGYDAYVQRIVFPLEGNL
jgi:DNA primase